MILLGYILSGFYNCLPSTCSTNFAAPALKDLKSKKSPFLLDFVPLSILVCYIQIGFDDPVINLKLVGIFKSVTSIDKSSLT